MLDDAFTCKLDALMLTCVKTDNVLWIMMLDDAQTCAKTCNNDAGWMILWQIGGFHWVTSDLLDSSMKIFLPGDGW